MDAPFIYLTMKRILFFITVLLVVCSCQKEIKNTSGHIKELTDSTMVTVVDNYNITFDITQTRYDNGLVQPGDSVNVHYVGDLREKKAKAVIVNLVPRKGTVMEITGEPDLSKELKTRNMTDEEQKAIDGFVRESQKHGH